MALKQVQLKEKSDSLLLEIIKQRKVDDKSGASKKDAVADAIELLHKREVK